MEKQTEVNLFYQECEKKYNALLEEIMQKDCQRVEFLRGMLAAYREIVETRQGWVKKQVNDFSYFK